MWDHHTVTMLEDLWNSNSHDYKSRNVHKEQNGFRPGRLTTDLIFILRQLTEKKVGGQWRKSDQIYRYN